MGQALPKSQDERLDGPVLDPAAGPCSEPLSPIVVLSGGCFWGIQHYVSRNFGNRHPNSINSTKVGFMSITAQPKLSQPTYKQVCTGQSGHVEALWVELENPQDDFENLIRFFFGMHDSTTKRRQGADRGQQYSSIIFCSDVAQQEVVERVKVELQDLLERRVVQCFVGRTVQTLVFGKLHPFCAAGERHQEYLSKHPNGYCNHFVRTRDRKPQRLHRKWKLNLPAPFVPTFASS